MEEHALFRGAAAAAPAGGAGQGAGQTLVGYPARDAEEGYWRVFTSLLLNSYYRIREDDIVDSHEFATEQDPSRPSTLRIKAGAPVEMVRTETAPAGAAGYLSGPLAPGGVMPMGPVTAGEAQVAPAVIASIMYCPAAGAAVFSYFRCF